MLLNHPPPYLDEAWGSWLWRLAQRNYVASPYELLPSTRSQTTVPYEPVAFRTLAELTNTSVETLHAHTPHQFAPLLQPLETSAAVLVLPTQQPLTLAPLHPNRDFFTSRFGWCPACLREARYVRLHWHVPLVVACVLHACWLLEACPVCTAPLREAEVLRGRCSHCGFVLEQAHSVPIPPDDVLLTLQREILAWLYHPEQSHLGLSHVPVGVLLRVLYGLRFAVQRAGDDWAFHHVPDGISVPQRDILKQRSLTVFERGCLYATAYRGLLDYPHGFYRFLDAYRTRPAPREKTGLRSEFGTLYISWFQRFWKHPAFDFIQQVFNDYLLEHLPVYQIVNTTRVRDYPELLDRVSYLDLKQTARYLEISVKGVYRLVEEGHLTAHRFPQDPLGVWFARAELEGCKERWNQHLPFLAVVQQLGLSKRLTLELLHAQLLHRVPAQAGLKQRGVFVERDSLQTFLNRLKMVTTVRPMSEQGIPLRLVCIRNGSVKMNLTRVLTRVLEGKLLAYHPNASRLPLTALWFAPQAVQDLAHNVKVESDWVTKEEARMYLGVGWRVMHFLLTRGWLRPVMSLGRKQFFSRQEVHSLHTTCIFTVEIQRTLGIPAAIIHSLVEQGIWFPKTERRTGEPYIFERLQFQHWQQTYIMLPELKQLAPDFAWIAERLRQAGIFPIVQAPLMYSRKEVMAALQPDEP